MSELFPKSIMKYICATIQTSHEFSIQQWDVPVQYLRASASLSHGGTIARGCCPALYCVTLSHCHTVTLSQLLISLLISTQLAGLAMVGLVCSLKTIEWHTNLLARSAHQADHSQWRYSYDLLKVRVKS